MSELLTFAEVAVLMRVSRRTVNRFVSRKLLRCVDMGHRTKRFRPADVERAIAKMTGEEWR